MCTVSSIILLLNIMGHRHGIYLKKWTMTAKKGVIHQLPIWECNLTFNISQILKDEFLFLFIQFLQLWRFQCLGIDLDYSLSQSWHSQGNIFTFQTPFSHKHKIFIIIINTLFCFKINKREYHFSQIIFFPLQKLFSTSTSG